MSADVLRDWWEQTARADLDACVPKMAEYGSDDLEDIGQELAAMMANSGSTQGPDGTEIGIYFYLRGKLSRWRSAIERGELCSDDTLHDIVVYAMMARANRAGVWGP